VKLVLIPLRYGLEHAAVLARHLGLRQEPDNPIWALGVEGLLAIDRALTARRSCDVRIVSVGGPAAERPRHLKVMPGYPLRPLLLDECSELMRVINGGVMTGQELPDVQMGLDTECTGLTLLPQDPSSELLGFMRPGWNRSSYSNCFAGALRGPFVGRFTTALRGERRACISCGFCERVCPAGIMPHLIHKFLYHDAIDEAETAGLNLCVRCGLCSFVCPSKIELRAQFVRGQQTLQEELQAMEAQA
jgi:Na+-transporting NADH:ubiquinone oxidoreductase subunit A